MIEQDGLGWFFFLAAHNSVLAGKDFSAICTACFLKGNEKKQ